MKRKILPILFASILMLAGCAGGDNTPKLTSMTITNKTELQQDWYVGDDDRTINVVSDPVLKYNDEWKASGHLRLKVTDNTIIGYDGIGHMISAKKPGTTKVAVLYYGIEYDSVEITIGTTRPEPSVSSGKTLNEIYTEVTTHSDPTSGHQRYAGTYEVKTVAYDAQGTMTIKDVTKPDGLLVYGSSKNMTFTWVTPGKYTYNNPNDFNNDTDLMNIEPGDSVTVEMIGMMYNGTTFELLAKITSVQKATRPDPTSITILNKEDLKFYVGENTTLTTQILPAEASKLIDWTVTNGTGKAKVSTQGVVNCIKEGTVTITATARGTTVSDSINVTIGASRDNGLVVNPEVNTPYKMSFTRDGSHYFYNGKVKSSYYGDSTTKYSEAVDVTLEAKNDGYNLFYMDGTTKKYLGVHEGGGHINFKYDLTADNATLCTWDEDLHTLVLHDTPDGGTSPVEYMFTNDSQNVTSFRCNLAADVRSSTRYVPVHFHNAEPIEPIEMITFAEAVTKLDAITLPESGKTTTIGGVQYSFEGVVKSKGEWSEGYNNGDIVITATAGTTEITIFRMTDKTVFDSLSEGDSLTVTGHLALYNDKGARKNEVTDATVVKNLL